MSAILVRKWGSGTTHLADVPDGLAMETTIFGSRCQIIQEPIVTACRVTLQANESGRIGDCIIVMLPDQLTCRTCSRLTGMPTR